MDRNGVTEDNSERGDHAWAEGEVSRWGGGTRKKQRKTSARKPERSLRSDGM